MHFSYTARRQIPFLKHVTILLIALLCVSLHAPRAAAEGEKELFLIAQKAFDDGFYDVAMRYIDQLLTAYPSSDKRIQAQLLLGQCYFFSNQYLKAYDIFQGLLQYAELKDATLFWLGETYLKGTDYAQAEKQYTELIKLYPQSPYTPQASYSLGWVYFEQGNYAHAQQTFSRLRQQFPAHQLAEDALFKLAECDYNLQHYTVAIEQFEKYLASYPQSTRQAEAYFYIAEAYYYLGEPLQSIGYYAKTADISFDNNLTLMAKISMGWGYLKLGKLDLAKQRFDDALAFSEQKGIVSDDIFLGQANLYTEMNEPQHAITAYTKLIENFPNSNRITEAYLGKANTYYTLTDYDNAIASYTGLIKNFCAKAEHATICEKAYFGLAWAYLKKGSIDDAIKTFQSVKNKASNDTVKISALTQIGDAYQDVDQLDKAIEIYDEILHAYPESPYADYVQYRQAIALLKQEKIDAATLSFQALQSNFPNSKYLADVQYYLAVAYFKNGDWKTAATHSKTFITDSPEATDFLAEAYYILAISQFNLTDHKEALKTFAILTKNYPNETTVAQTAALYTARCHYELGNIPEAIKEFEQILTHYPRTDAAQEVLIRLGDYYLEKADFTQAIRYYTQCITDFPSSEKIPLVYYELGQCYQALEHYDRAIEAFQKIGPSKNKELFLKAQLAIAQIFSLELDPDAAIRTYQDIIKRSPEFQRDAYIKIAEMAKNKQNYADTLTAYQHALAAPQSLSKISDAELQFSISDTYEILNKKTEALDTYLKIPYLYPQNTYWVAQAYLRAARIFEHDEQWDQATIIYTKVLGLKTDEVKFAQERLDWIRTNIIPVGK